MKLTVLGCGSSGGVPRIGNDWGACDPNEPRNRRRRCSALVEQGDTTLLVDTPPELREQLLSVGTRRLDGVLYTHSHADQAHGIDDLRAFFIRERARVDVYSDPETLAALRHRFDYCFEQQPDSYYPPILRAHTIDGPFRIGGINVVPFCQDHGEMPSLGFRFGPIAYSADLVGLPEASFAALAGVDVWVVDALRYRPHPSHAHLDLVLEWAERLKPRRTILTNMHVDMDYRTLVNDLPKGVEPAYDGMVIEA